MLVSVVVCTNTRSTFAAVTPVWRHGWATVQDMIFSHGGNLSVVTDEAHSFLGRHYPMVAFASGYGCDRGKGMYQETAALISASKLRAINPRVKNIFYFKSHLESQIVSCSSANSTWHANRAAWLLMGDDGSPINRGHFGFLDVRLPAVQDFWVGHLLNLLNQTVAPPMEGQHPPPTLPRVASTAVSSKPLIDGVFVDGCPGEHTGFPCKGTTNCLSPGHWEAYSTALYAMTARLQSALNANGHEQVVLCNGMDDTYALNHAAPAHGTAQTGGSMVDHFGVYNFINQTSGADYAWKTTDMQQLFDDVIGSPLNTNRTIQIKGWYCPATCSTSCLALFPSATLCHHNHHNRARPCLHLPAPDFFPLYAVQCAGLQQAAP